MSTIFKIIQVFLLSTIKYFYAPFHGIAIGLQFWPIFFSLISGGILSFLFYYNITDLIILYVDHLKPITTKLFPKSWQKAYLQHKEKRIQKKQTHKKFTHRNKTLIKIRGNCGLWGIILLSPILISLPIGSFLLRKYYHRSRIAIASMLTSIVVEGFILCVMYWHMAKI